MPKASLENHGELVELIININNNNKKIHHLSKVFCVHLCVCLYYSNGYKKLRTETQNLLDNPLSPQTINRKGF